MISSDKERIIEISKEINQLQEAEKSTGGYVENECCRIKEPELVYDYGEIFNDKIRKLVKELMELLVR